jgi:hypothetical protein
MKGSEETFFDTNILRFSEKSLESNDLVEIGKIFELCKRTSFYLSHNVEFSIIADYFLIARDKSSCDMNRIAGL